MFPGEMKDALSEMGEKPFRASQVFSWLHRGARFSEMTNLPLSLREKLAEEWQFILYHALAGLKRLYTQGHFTESRGCSEAIRELRRRADNVQAFIEDCIGDAPGKRVMRSLVFEAYENYCRENKRQSCGKGRFFERLNEVYQIKRYATDGYCYQDIALHTAGEYIEGTDNEDFIELEPEETTPFDRHTENNNDNERR